MLTAWRSRSSGRSSTPDIPTSKSPRSTEASIELHATCTNPGRRPSPCAIIPAISTSKPRTRDGSAGSASTNGAPPSASPPQRSTGRAACDAAERHPAASSATAALAAIARAAVEPCLTTSATIARRLGYGAACDERREQHRARAAAARSVHAGGGGVRPRRLVAAGRRIDAQRFIEGDDEQTVGPKRRRRHDQRHPVFQELVRRHEAARLPVLARPIVAVVAEARTDEREVGCARRRAKRA